MLRFIMVGHCTQLQLCLKEVHFEWLGRWVSLRMERACCGKPAPRKRMQCPTNRGFVILARELWWIIQWFRCCRQLTEFKKAAVGRWDVCWRIDTGFISPCHALPCFPQGRTDPFSSHLRLSNRAAAELELILAEDPMCGGNLLRLLEHEKHI